MAVSRRSSSRLRSGGAVSRHSSSSRNSDASSGYCCAANCSRVMLLTWPLTMNREIVE